MFIGRRQELDELKKFLNSSSSRVAMIYGKRRVGKTTLLERAMAETKVNYLFFEASETSYKANLDAFTSILSSKLEISLGSYASFTELFSFLKSFSRSFVIVIDEFQYLIMNQKEHEIESEFKQITDQLSDKIKLVLTGSFVTMMKDIILSNRPLFGRFQLIINLNELDYIDSREFYPELSYYDCIRFYSVFGGSPYILSMLDEKEPLEENIKRLILNPTGAIRTYIEYVLFQEVKKVSPLNDILMVLGNGKLRYSEIETKLNLKSTGLLSKHLEILEKMDFINIVIPINKKEEDKKKFYSIKDNLLRFYFSYIVANKSQLQNLGADLFYSAYIEPSLNTFISYRFEDISRTFLRYRAEREGAPILDVGTYWYNDKIKKQNGEFDCVLKFRTHYSVYEVKFFNHPLSEQEILEEVEQIKAVPEFNNAYIGFICSGGFDESKPKGYDYLRLDHIFFEK